MSIINNGVLGDSGSALSTDEKIALETLTGVQGRYLGFLVLEDGDVLPTVAPDGDTHKENDFYLVLYGDTYLAVNKKPSLSFIIYTRGNWVYKLPEDILLNKSVLDKFGEDANGKPTYNGNAIDTTIAQRDVYDALNSTDNTISLSAKQGKILKDLIDAKEPIINKNTAFNKDFGNASNEIARGNHNHDSIYEPKNSNIQAHILDTNNPHQVNKAQIGLGNVDNTSDINKPISALMQSALDTKEPLINRDYAGARSHYGFVYQNYPYFPTQTVWIKIPKGINRTYSKMFHFVIDMFLYPSANMQIDVSGYYYTYNSYQHIHNYSAVATLDDSGTRSTIQCYLRSAKEWDNFYLEIPIGLWKGYYNASLVGIKVRTYQLLEYDDFTFLENSFGFIDEALEMNFGDRTGWTITADAGLLKAGYDDPTKLLEFRRQTNTYFTNGASGYLTFDFGSNKKPQWLRQNQSADTSFTNTTLEYSDDNATWTVERTFDIVGNTDINLKSNVESHRYWRLGYNSATAVPWIYEINFAFGV